MITIQLQSMFWKYPRTIIILGYIKLSCATYVRAIRFGEDHKVVLSDDVLHKLNGFSMFISLIILLYLEKV